ncbi:MAG: ABC transporter ATP-binding protein [Candidatus Roseilinea sp.]|uniref:ABC transporter ATP-binding protein n=1 Tax=Candidatus Roseilinea sp. TaxID=2838777 RepID=UPI00404B2905
MAAYLTAEAISVIYPNGVEALRRFTLEVKRGEFVAVVGPSGCGKSTLLRTLAGLLLPSAGEICLNGQRMTQPSRQVGMLFQEPALLPWRTVEENIRLPFELGNAKQRGIDPATLKARIASLIKLVGLTGFERAYPRELSGGMAQRAALARALVTEPPILLLDEPFGALDSLTRETLTAALESIWRASHTTGVLVTHSIPEAVFLADRIVVSTPRPGQVAGVVKVLLPRPRSWEMERLPEFVEAVQTARSLLGNNQN